MLIACTSKQKNFIPISFTQDTAFSPMMMDKVKKGLAIFSG
jgi:hypothetical protein